MGLSIDDVCQLTLIHNPEIKKAIWIAKSFKGSYLSSDGQFDWNLSSSTRQSQNNYLSQDGDIYNTLYGLDIYETKNKSYSLGLIKSFKSGMRINKSLSVNRSSNNIPGNLMTTNSPSLDLSITQPLLKGMGHQSAAANYQSSQLLRDAYFYNIKHTISIELHSVVSAYWDYLSSSENLKLYTEAEKRAKEVLNITKALIEAGVKPNSDLVQIKADVAEKLAKELM